MYIEKKNYPHILYIPLFKKKAHIIEGVFIGKTTGKNKQTKHKKREQTKNNVPIG